MRSYRHHGMPSRQSPLVLVQLIFAWQLMNVGLLYTPVSIYQMTRGALVLFVGMLSVMFLRRRLWLYQSVLFLCFPVLHPQLCTDGSLSSPLSLACLWLGSAAP
jgi:drug/metabolite transporter (DMT)-like permease